MKLLNLRRKLATVLSLTLAGTMVVPMLPAASLPVAFADDDSSSDEFWLMFPDNVNAARLALFIAGDVATTGAVSGPGMPAIPFSVTPGEVTEVVIPLSRRVTAHNLVQGLGIQVTAGEEVTVYGYSDGQASTDAFLGLPTDVLGLEYIVLDTPNTRVHSVDAAEFGIVATRDNTNVTITLSSAVSGRQAGVPYTVVLNKGETYQAKNTGSGAATLTGSTIVASAPVAVFGGNRCTNLPVNDFKKACDHVVEQLPPVERWGSNFVTVPLESRSRGDSFAFVAQENDTEVYIDGVLRGTYGRGESEFLVLDGVREWSATKPILLAQNANSQRFDSARLGDPFMMLVPPIEQFLDSYTFATVQDEIQADYVNIVVPTLAIDSLRLDGQPVNSSLFSAVGTLGYSGGSVPVSAGTHTVEGAVGFGLASYGFGSFVSYGYAGGVGQRDVENTDRWDEGGPALSTSAADVFAPAGLDQSTFGEELVFVEERPDELAVMIATKPPKGFGGYSKTLAVVPTTTGTATTVTVGTVRISGDGKVVAYTTQTRTDLPNGTIGRVATLHYGPARGDLAEIDLTGIDTGSFGAKIDLDHTGENLIFSARPTGTIETNLYLVDPSTSTVAPLADTLTAGNFSDPSISGDGRWVSFTSTANLDAQLDDEGDADIFVIDRTNPSDSARRISRTDFGTTAVDFDAAVKPLNGQSEISDDGRFIAFVSVADNLIDRELEQPTVLLHDRDSDQDEIYDEAEETSTTQVARDRSSTIQSRPTVTNNGRRVSWTERTADGSTTQMLIADRPNSLVSFSLRSPFRRPLRLESAVNLERPTLGSVTKAGNSYSLISRDDFLKDRVYRGAVNRPTSRFPDVPHQVLAMPNVYRPVVSDPVDTGSGALVAHTVDLAAPGGSSALTFERSYDSARWFEGPLGLGWASNWDAWLNVSLPETPVFVNEYGRPFDFQAKPDGSYTRPPELLADLVVVTGGYELQWFDGHTSVFDAGGTLTGTRSPSSADLTIARDTTGLIERIDSDAGHSMSFEYGLDADGESRLAHVTMSDGRTAVFTYDDVTGPTAGILSAVTTPANTTTYTHDTDGRIVQQSDTTGVVTHVTEYDEGTGRVVHQTLPTGEVTVFAYDDEQLNTTVTDVTTGEQVTYWFDTSGRLERITDPAGNETTTAWSADGQPTDFVDRLGNNPSATYDESGNLTSATDPVSGTTSYVYDESNRVVSVTEPTNALTTMTYIGDERTPSSVTDALGHTTTFMVDDGLVTSVVDADGVTTSYAYDVHRRMVETTNGLGNTWTYEFDDAGRPIASTTPLGFESSRTYDDAGRVLTSTAADGGVTSYAYDADGRNLTTTDPVGAVVANTYDPATGLLESTSDPEGRVTTYVYNALAELVAVEANDGGISSTDYGTLGRVTATRDALGRETSYAYDANGNRTEVIAPDGGVTRTEFDSAGRVSALEDPLGRRTTQSYDDFGRLLQVVRPDGTSMRYTYDLVGRQIEMIAPDGGVASTQFTPAGRTASVIDAVDGVTSYGYDAAGQIDAVTDPNGFVTSLSYDADGRRIAVTTPEGLITNWDYDPMDRVTKIVDPSGVEIVRTYTLRGELQTERREGDGIVRYEYNADGTMASVTDALGNATSYTYDAAGRPATQIDATGAVEKMEYNSAGQLVTRTDRLGQRTQIDYDTVGRLATVADPTGRTTNLAYDTAGQLSNRTFGDGTTIGYAYDELGRRIEMTDSTGVTTYSYDANGRPVEVAAPNGTLGYSYDTAGRRTGLTYPDGATVTYNYDAAGRLVGLADPVTGQIDYTLDDDGRLVLTELPDGETRSFDFVNDQMVRHQDHGRTTEVTYDESGRVATLTGSQNHTYTYDQAGQLLQSVQDEGTYAYTYGTRGELTSISDPNRTRSFTHNANVEIETILDGAGRVGNVRYDAAGRMVEHADPDGTITTYAYDSRGLLVETVRTPPDPDPCAGLIATITGTDGDDILQGTWQDDVIFGLDGNDIINGASGADVICGGDGDDIINGQSQNDTIFGGDGDDTIDGADGADTIDGGPGHDTITGASQPDTIQGGDGDDTIDGGPGDDILDGGNGDDIVDGSWQNDTCDDAEVAPGCETTTFDGETGQGGTVGMPIVCGGKIVTIIGTDGDDILQGTWQDDVIFGLGGNDIINGASGADVICGGDGDDIINGQSQNDTIFGGDGDDTIDGGPGDDILDGGNGDDTVDGSWQNDTCDDAETAISCEISTANGETVTSTSTPVQGSAVVPFAADSGFHETRTYSGDNVLTAVDRSRPETASAVTALLWDVTLSVPEVVVLDDGIPQTSTYGYERERTGDTKGAFTVLGDQVSANEEPSATGPYGPASASGSLQFGYRSELTTESGIHLRNRELDLDLAVFRTRDPLAGVEGFASFTNPYHYAANDPVGYVDSLGLRQTDASLGTPGLDPIGAGNGPEILQSRGPIPLVPRNPVPLIPEVAKKTSRALKSLTVATVVIGLLDSWPTDQEVNEQLAKAVFPQLRDPSIVEESRGVFTKQKRGGYDCGSEALANTAQNGGGDVLASALLLGREATNANGVPGTAPKQTTAAAVWCIDGVSGSLLGRNASGDGAPQGFATVSRASVNSVLEGTNFHAETNILETVTEVVRPRRGYPPVGSFGYLVIAADRPVCNLCKGPIKRWSAQYPGIVVITVDPQRVVGYIGGVEMR